MAWLKVTDTVVALLTPVAPALGLTELTLGAGPSVKNDEVKVLARGLPDVSLTAGPVVPPRTVRV
jgi:hypothetical protein